MVGILLFWVAITLFEDDHPILGTLTLLVAILPWKVLGA